MASRRALTRLSLRSVTSVAARRASPLQTAPLIQSSSSSPRIAAPQPPRHQQPAHTRWHSTDHGSKSKVYDFNAIKALIAAPSPTRILIDVREPHEFAAGAIPGAHNMPIASQPDALFLPADEFEERLGFGKPRAEDEVVFYCKAGVRSSSAAQLAQQVGYTRVGEYRGSWMEWVREGGEAVKGET